MKNVVFALIVVTLVMLLSSTVLSAQDIEPTPGRTVIATPVVTIWKAFLPVVINSGVAPAPAIPTPTPTVRPTPTFVVDVEV